MNQIEPTDKLPNLRWSKHSQNEIIMTGEDLVEMSDFVWRIGNIASVGFIYSSLVNPPWMWFVLAEDISIGDLMDFRRLSIKIPKETLTCVDENFPAAFKFAKLYGFEPTGEVLDYFGKAYKVMRKK